MKPAIVFPRRIVNSETGAERNLSKVRNRLSRGMETGPMDEAAKKTVWATSTGIALDAGISRPMIKDKNMEKGKRIPNIKEGGRR